MEVESESESSDSSTDSDPDHPPSQIQDKTTKKLKKIEAVKLASIYDSMKQLGYTPKKFIKAFLENTDKKYTGHRRYWGSERGWESTLAVLDAIKKVVRKKKKNRKLWDDFILSEATKIVISQKPPSGAYPRGAYHSSTTITEELFTQECKDERDTDLVEDHMPFLFRLVCNKLNARPVKKVPSADPSQDDVLPVEEDSDSDTEEVPEDLFDEADPRIRAECQSTCDHGRRVRMTAKTVCSMVAFVYNRRNNGHQLANALTFLACGVLDRVNQFFNYIGISSSRKTAHQALKRLGRQSREKENQMFHGTWGYVHHPNSEMLASIPATDLTMESYRKAMATVPSFEVLPKMFLPSRDEEDSWELVLKAQIADVLLEYVASPANSKVPIPTSPPAVDQLSADLPDITMLKLMVASDNSAQGVGEVFDSLLEQTNMSMTDFASRLQIIDGDLGTCTNIHSLQSQRIPSQHIEEDMNNMCTLLGGSHTLWNIAQAIYSKHYGDDSDAQDSGAWRFLEGMSIPANKMLDKKDYTLMIQNIVKIHKAALVHCIKTVMGTPKAPVPEELPKVSSRVIKGTIDKTYDEFFTATAKDSASNRTSPKLLNLMLRLSDFATIVEGNAAIKSGDIGRMMNVWKRWSVIAQGIKKLTQYSIQLPQMVILLNEILPKGERKLILHSLFIAPSGRHQHFLAKDQHLEDQNYWLKYFFNRSGRGTDIDRLKDVLQSLIHGLTSDAGKDHTYQSHRCKINLKSINNCLRMCNQNDICHKAPSLNDYEPIPIDDFYSTGILKLKEKHRQKGKPINKLRPTGIITWNDTWEEGHDLENTFNHSDVSSEGNIEPNQSEASISEASTQSSNGSE
ncbi:hypothetical protein MJO29_002580 [Puccinia striiformis f. sp. tritici]|nr:hypothetical protein MJO29_002580 [Puccinia striiformis f. sp. tritici]